MPISTNCSKAFNCNELTLINKGTQPVTIAGVLPLNPGESITYYALPGDLNVTCYDITFQDQRAAGALLIAVVKTYHI